MKIDIEFVQCIHTRVHILINSCLLSIKHGLITRLLLTKAYYIVTVTPILYCLYFCVGSLMFRIKQFDAVRHAVQNKRFQNTSQTHFKCLNENKALESKRLKFEHTKSMLCLCIPCFIFSTSHDMIEHKLV